MTINQQMFMYAVEEMNFSKAAEKAYVSQQCLSNHIKRLENSCGVKLFERSPHLMLTEAGKILYQSFVQIRDIEESTTQRLLANETDVHGTIRFGTHLNRARIFLLEPFLEFHEQYPNVQLKVISAHTAIADQMLLENRVDVILGANGSPIPGTNRDVIGSESTVFLASPKLLRSIIPDWNLNRTTITKQELALFPITAAANISMMAQTLNHSMNYDNLELKYTFLIDDNTSQLEFCKAGKAIMFCPENQLIGREALIQTGSEDKLQLLTLDTYADIMNISIYTSAQRDLPNYVTNFCSMVALHYQRKIADVRNRFHLKADENLVRL